jgi:hypothetical protein
MKHILVVIAALISFSGAAHAQPFIEVGVGAVVGGCIANGYSESAAPALSAIRGSPPEAVNVHCSRGAIGIAAIGYQITERLSAQYEHISSVPDGHDRGLEVLSIRYRYTFK